jgi:hypothetical protein
LGDLRDKFPAHVAGDDGGDDGGDDDALRAADVSEHAAFARRNQDRKHSRFSVNGLWILRSLAGWAGIYALGIGFAATAMRWESFSCAVPVLSGVSLIAAGAFQFTRWKMTGLLRCRSPLGCAAFCPERETSFCSVANKVRLAASVALLR